MPRQFTYTGKIPPDVTYNVQRIEEYLEFFHKYFRRHVVRFRREARNRGVPVTTDDIVKDLMRQAATMVNDFREGHPSHHMSLENRLFIMKLIKEEDLLRQGLLGSTAKTEAENQRKAAQDPRNFY